jgi:phosphatidate phosphatase APP1
VKTSPAILVVFLLIGAPQALAAPKPGPIDSIGIISDIDDTVRPTGSLHLGRALEVTTGSTDRGRAVKAFAGMSKLYEVLLTHRKGNAFTDEFFVSGSGKEISEHLHDFLWDSDFSLEHVVDPLLTPGPLDGLAKYKENHFKDILKQYPKTVFYFFGDDTQKDPESIGWAQQKFPKQIAGAYIHSIEGVLPAKAGETPYFTAVDVALNELKLGNLSADEAEEVAAALLNDPTFNDDVIPVYAKLCPPSGWLDSLGASLNLTLVGDLKKDLTEIESRVQPICTPDRKPRDWP